MKNHVIRGISAQAFREHGIVFSINGPVKEVPWSLVLVQAVWHNFGVQVILWRLEKFLKKLEEKRYREKHTRSLLLEDGNNDFESNDWRNICSWSFSTLYTLMFISMHILYTVLYTFPKVLARRICLTIKSFFSWWSFPLFPWPFHVWFRRDIVRRN